MAPQIPLRVLVVEDGEDAAQSLAMLLRLHGCLVDVAADCSSAVEAAMANPPDAVLLDISLPGCDGYAVARRLRGLPGARPLLAALTGYAQDSDRRRSAEEGLDHHLVKPVEPDELLRLLRRHAHGLGQCEP